MAPEKVHCGSLPGLPRAGKSGDAGKADRGIPPAIQRNPLGALHQDHSSGKIRRKTGRAVQQDPGQAQRHAGGY